MEYRITINDSQGKWAVISDTQEGLLGHHYKFKPLKAVIVKDSYDESDLYYFRNVKTPIPAGTEVVIDNWWQNFYGSYFRIIYNEQEYDVLTNCVKIEN